MSAALGFPCQQGGPTASGRSQIWTRPASPCSYSGGISLTGRRLRLVCSAAVDAAGHKPPCTCLCCGAALWLHVCRGTLRAAAAPGRSYPPLPSHGACHPSPRLLFWRSGAHDDLWREAEGTIVALISPKVCLLFAFSSFSAFECLFDKRHAMFGVSTLHAGALPSWPPRPPRPTAPLVLWASSQLVCLCSLQVRAEGDFSLSVDACDQVGAGSQINMRAFCLFCWAQLVQAWLLAERGRLRPDGSLQGLQYLRLRCSCALAQFVLQGSSPSLA